MKGLTLTTREQNRLQTLNGVLEKHWPMREAAKIMGVSERQGWRILAAYRRKAQPLQFFLVISRYIHVSMWPFTHYL